MLTKSNPNHEMWTKKYTIVSQRELPLTAMLIKVGWIWSDHKKPHKVNIYDNTGLEPLFPFALKEELEAKSNPDHPKTKIYKGVEISGKKGAWKVEAYGKKFKSLEKARKFISDKVAGATKPDQRCVRKIKGVRCKGIVVLTNPHCYKCNKCKAEYKEA